jgi:4-amino-4-deoxy-L-arabinose transferase-like glycosyltransferase
MNQNGSPGAQKLTLFRIHCKFVRCEPGRTILSLWQLLRKLRDECSTSRLDRRPELARGESFRAMFQDGTRTPGYPLYIAFFYWLTDSPLRWVRISQVILSVLIIPLAYVAVVRLTWSARAGLGAAALVTMWPPLFHFGPNLGAESGSIILAGLLVVVLTAPAQPASLRHLVALALLVVTLIYYKPNHIFFIIPVIVYLAHCTAWTRRALVRDVPVFLGVLGSAIAPWSAFISIQQSKFVPLSTFQGSNLYLGAGLGSISDDLDHRSLPVRYAEAHRLSDNDPLPESLPMGLHDKLCSERAIERWKSRPVETMTHGVLKVLHAFGGSMRDVRDIGVVTVSIVSCLISLVIWLRSPSLRSWCLFFWASIAVVALQAFVFLTNQRFRIVLFDFPAMITIALGAYTLFPKLFQSEMASSIPNQGRAVSR